MHLLLLTLVLTLAMVATVFSHGDHGGDHGSHSRKSDWGVFGADSDGTTTVTKFHSKLVKEGGACQQFPNTPERLTLLRELTSVVQPGGGGFSVFGGPDQNELVANGRAGNGGSAFEGGCATVVKPGADGQPEMVAPWFLLPCHCSTQAFSNSTGMAAAMTCVIDAPGKDGAPRQKFVCTGEYAVEPLNE